MCYLSPSLFLVATTMQRGGRLAFLVACPGVRACVGASERFESGGKAGRWGQVEYGGRRGVAGRFCGRGSLE